MDFSDEELIELAAVGLRPGRLQRLHQIVLVDNLDRAGRKTWSVREKRRLRRIRAAMQRKQRCIEAA